MEEEIKFQHSYNKWTILKYIINGRLVNKLYFSDEDFLTL